MYHTTCSLSLEKQKNDKEKPSNSGSDYCTAACPPIPADTDPDDPASRQRSISHNVASPPPSPAIFWFPIGARDSPDHRNPTLQFYPGRTVF